MRPTCRYFVNNSVGLGVYGEKAYGILKCILTSGEIQRSQWMTFGMMRRKGEKWTVFCPTSNVSHNYYPVVKPDGQISVAIVGSTMSTAKIEADETDDKDWTWKTDRKSVCNLLTSYIAFMTVTTSDPEELLEFSTDDGLKEYSMNDFKCLRIIIEKHGAASAKVKSMYGAERCEAIQGKPATDIIMINAAMMLKRSLRTAIVNEFNDFHSSIRAYQNGTRHVKLKDAKVAALIVEKEERIARISKMMKEDLPKFFKDAPEEDIQIGIDDICTIFPTDVVISKMIW